MCAYGLAMLKDTIEVFLFLYVRNMKNCAYTYTYNRLWVAEQPHRKIALPKIEIVFDTIKYQWKCTTFTIDALGFFH